MADIDTFERSLAGAFLRLADDVTGAVDAAAVAHRVALEHPRGPEAAGRWRPLAIPRPAWVLLLGAALLVALVGGALVVGSQLQRKLPAVVPPVGELFECPPGSTPDNPGPVDQARPAEDWDALPSLPSLAFDRRAGKLVALFDIGETWTFDVCTNTWARVHPSQEPPEGTGGLVYDVDSDLTIASSGTRVWVYDLQANTWTEKGPTPPFVDDIGLQFYDPVSGHVVALADDDNDGTLGLELWSYAVESDTWTPIPQAEPLVIGPSYEFFSYDASVDRLVAYANGSEAKTWLFDLRTGTWSGTSAVTPSGFTAGLFGQVPAIAYDAAAQRTVLLGQGHAAAYDATADRWETLFGGSASEDQPSACGTRPECRQMPFMVYDPVNERLVVYGGWTGSGWISPDDVLAFDTRTREWTVLLEASPAQ